ncbi:murein hydrolase activator EnvC family protein [Vagococcus silagei]|uniref:Peptidase M23 n=1 Tax=Vagococcus silagei TaxID=2508885 RepID=A0A4S3B7D6_9ENTE|nr:peptidoglycan DD-metalloendopeptidase family protein [Vagococcus silagei]THB61960.1 peptidase M23 [Vagococcus silagei]
MKYKKLIAMSIAVSILGSSSAGIVASAESIDSKLATEEKKINDLSKQEKEINSELATLEATIKDLSSEKESLMEEKLKLEKEVNKIHEEIKALEKTIAKRTDKIAEQARSAQMNQSDQDLLNVILDSTSVSDAISRTMAYSTLVSNNSDIVEAQKKDQDELAKKQAKLENKVNEILTKAEELKTKEAELEASKNAQVKVAQAILKNLDGAKGNKASLLSQKAQAERVQKENEEKAKALADQVKAAKAAQEQAEKEMEVSIPKSINRNTGQTGKTDNSKSPLSASGFQRPIPNITISSGFGGREDPTGSAGTFHDGIDMPGSLNQPVYASRAGTVVESSYHPSAGNHVIIQHDNGYYTYYMHFNSLGVAAGTHVEAGDVVGLMGTTGNSTGVHLHFGIATGIWSGFLDPGPFIGLY